MVAEIILREYLRRGGAQRREHAGRASRALCGCLGERFSDPVIQPERARMKRRSELIRHTIELLEHDDSFVARAAARAEFERLW